MSPRSSVRASCAPSSAPTGLARAPSSMCCGALTPTTGRVLFRGEDVTALPQHAYARLGIAKSFQITNVFKQLSAHENVRVAVQMRTARFDFLRSRSALTEVADQAQALLERVGLGTVGRRT